MSGAPPSTGPSPRGAPPATRCLSVKLSSCSFGKVEKWFVLVKLNGVAGAPKLRTEVLTSPSDRPAFQRDTLRFRLPDDGADPTKATLALDLLAATAARAAASIREELEPCTVVSMTGPQPRFLSALPGHNRQDSLTPPQPACLVNGSHLLNHRFN